MAQLHPLNLVLAASEVVPYAKTGGLADVAGALPQEFAKLGHDVIVLLPRYREVSASGRTFRPVVTISLDTPQGVLDAVIEEDLVPVLEEDEDRRGCAEGDAAGGQGVRGHSSAREPDDGARCEAART